MAKVTRLFPASQRIKLLKQTPSTPTGVLFPWAGIEFNLMPLTFDQLLSVTTVLDEGAELLKKLMGAQTSDDGASVESMKDVSARALSYIANEVPGVISTIRDHLARSPGVCDAGTEKENEADRKVFEEWFGQQDAKALLVAFFPKIKEVLASRPLGISTPAESEAAPT